MGVHAVLLVWAVGVALQSASAQSPTASPCARALAEAITAATTELCLAEEEVRQAEAEQEGAAERSRHLNEAVQHYRRAVGLTSEVEGKARTLDALASVYDARHLNQLGHMEAVLRELVALQPNELAPMFRLAKSQEDRGLVDAAEDTLLSIRRQRPDALEPYQMLAQFYARRATELHRVREAQKPGQPTSGPGEPDENGIYRAGGPVRPHRADVAVYPPEALAAGIEGVVIAEIVVDESGVVTEARVVRSVPFLDEAALRAVRNWRYLPTLVGGEAVPVRMTVTVNFTKRQ